VVFLGRQLVAIISYSFARGSAVALIPWGDIVTVSVLQYTDKLLVALMICGCISHNRKRKQESVKKGVARA